LVRLTFSHKQFEEFFELKECCKGFENNLVLSLVQQKLFENGDKEELKIFPEVPEKLFQFSSSFLKLFLLNIGRCKSGNVLNFVDFLFLF